MSLFPAQRLWHRTVWLWLAAVLLVACLPGKRSNEPLPLDAKTSDSSAKDTAADGGDTILQDSKAEIADSSDAGDVADAHDASADTVTPVDTATEVEVGPDVPVGMGGCVTDTQCEALGVQICKVASCNLATGLCEWSEAPEKWPPATCKCGGAGMCSQGYCLSAKEENCDDGNACTQDFCDIILGCVHQPRNGAVCTDLDACTTGEICVGGTCVTKPLCPDTKNPCYTDTCNAGNCQTVAKTSSEPIACPGEGLCQTDGVCQGKLCITKEKADDGNPCTKDICDPTTGSVAHYPYLDQPCGGDPCTPGTCKSVDGVALPTCVTATLCKQADPCTPVTCKAGVCSTGTKLNSNEPCDDNNICTINTGCAKGQCKGTALVCEDGNPCTGPGGCLPASGCTAGLPVPDGSNCDDGNGCTTGDTCKSGACTGGTALKCNDGKACSKDSCDPIKGCVYDTSGCL